MLQWGLIAPRLGPASYSKVQDDGAVDVAVAWLSARHEEVDAAMTLLSTDERVRASRFVFEHDRRRFILGRARLRQLLAVQLGVSPASITFAYGPHGKPALGHPFRDSGLRFNLAHCGDLAVYAFARGREVGTDVESVRDLPDADPIASRFFSPRECADYRMLKPTDRPLGFFNCWTRKEAFIKALGAGLSHPLDSFAVSLAPDDPAEILWVGETTGAECGWSLDAFVPTPGYVAAIAVQTDLPV